MLEFFRETFAMHVERQQAWRKGCDHSHNMFLFLSHTVGTGDSCPQRDITASHISPLKLQLDTCIQAVCRLIWKLYTPLTIKFGFFFFPSFNLKDIPAGLGSESRLDRSKGESRTENILMDSSSTLINNEGN